jgi:hypothetical protein
MNFVTMTDTITFHNTNLSPESPCIEESKSYVRDNTTRLPHTDQPVNPDQGNNRCLLWQYDNIKHINMRVKKGSTIISYFVYKCNVYHFAN